MSSTADEQAPFRELFVEHAPYVLGLLRRLGVASTDVEDVAQEVFLTAHRRLSTFEGRSTLRTWICGIAVHAASNHRRRAYRRRELTGLALEVPVEATQERHVQRAEQAALLVEALDELSDKQRQVFVLYEVEELEMAEVARIVGCPRFTAYTRLRSARTKVRKHLGRRGYLGVGT